MGGWWYLEILPPISFMYALVVVVLKYVLRKEKVKQIIKKRSIES